MGKEEIWETAWRLAEWQVADDSWHISSVAQPCPTLRDPMDYTALQASLSITKSWSLLKFMSIESVMPSNHLILCCPLLLLPSIFLRSGYFQMSQLFASSGQRIVAQASASVLAMNIQGLIL